MVPDYFVEAANKVLEEVPDAHLLSLALGIFFRKLSSALHLNMSSRFHFTGFVKDRQIDQIWALTDMNVMPSVSEPFVSRRWKHSGWCPVILFKSIRGVRSNTACNQGRLLACQRIGWGYL